MMLQSLSCPPVLLSRAGNSVLMFKGITFKGHKDRKEYISIIPMFLLGFLNSLVSQNLTGQERIFLDR